MEEAEKKTEKKEDFGLAETEMAEAGLHFGHRTSRLHPKMEQYIAGIKNDVHLINLQKTIEKFEEALTFIRDLTSRGGVMLLIGTKIQHKNLVKAMATDCGFPYVVERWLGGTFTNFAVIRKRINYFQELEKKEREGEFEKYSKKEKAKMHQELNRLKIKYDGLQSLTQVPEAIFVVDLQKDRLAVKEAKAKAVKVVAISHTNVDPTLADYPIPASDDAISSVKYILNRVKEVILRARQKELETDLKSNDKSQMTNVKSIPNVK